MIVRAPAVKSRRLRRIGKPDFRPWIFPLALLLSWQLLTRSGWGHLDLIATPKAVLATALKQLTQAEFPLALGASLLRDLTGFLAGAAAGLAFGAALGIFPWAHRLLAPLFHALRQITLFAWIPLISIWVGYNNASRILLVALSVFYPVALAALDGVRNVALAQVEVGRVLGFGRLQLLTRVILPAAAPSILSGLNLALIYAWIATIGAEFLLPSFGSSGLGDTVIRGRAAFRTDIILFGMFAIGLIGWAIGVLARRLEKASPLNRPRFQTGHAHADA